MSGLENNGHWLMTLKLFGVFNYLKPNGSQLSLKSRKSEAVLLALALSDDSGLEREHLSNILWSDLTEARAKSGLRQALSRVRMAFGDAFITPRVGWIALNRSCVNCDLWALENLFTTRENSYTFDWPSEPFLVNCPMPTDLFAEWVEPKIQHTKLRLIEQSRSIVSNDEIPSKLCDGFAQLLLYLNHLDEENVSLVLSYLHNKGSQQQYLSVLNTYTRRLREVYNLSPSPEFVERHQRVPGERQPETVLPIQEPNGLKSNLHSQPMLNIKPFEVFGEKPPHRYLSVAIPEEITQQLAKQNWFSVNSNTHMGVYSAPGVSTVRAESLYNAYSLHGTVLTDDYAIRVTVKLIDDATGAIIWSDKYDRNLTELMPIQAEIVGNISEVLTSQVIEAEAINAHQKSDSKYEEVWTRTMKARYLFWRMSKANNLEARALLDPVIDLKTPPLPAQVTAVFVRLLDVWSLWSKDPEGDLLMAQKIAQRATRLYPTDPWSHFTLGTCLGVQGQLPKSIAILNRAIQLHPNFSAAIGTRGKYKVFLQDIRGAKDDLQTALTLNDVDPHYGLWQNALGIAYFMEKKYDEALIWAERAIATNSFWAHNYVLSSNCLIKLGQENRGRTHYEHVKKHLPNIANKGWKYSYPFVSSDDSVLFLDALKEYEL